MSYMSIPLWRDVEKTSSTENAPGFQKRKAPVKRSRSVRAVETFETTYAEGPFVRPPCKKHASLEERKNEILPDGRGRGVILPKERDLHPLINRQRKSA